MNDRTNRQIAGCKKSLLVGVIKSILTRSIRVAALFAFATPMDHATYTSDVEPPIEEYDEFGDVTLNRDDASPTIHYSSQI
jgi:hypothetical protein